MASLPGRASDAGPEWPVRCPACDSKGWNTLGDCAECGKRICDCCPDAIQVGAATLICAECRVKVADRIADSCMSDASLCDELDEFVAALPRLTAPVHIPQIPEWKGKVN